MEQIPTRPLGAQTRVRRAQRADRDAEWGSVAPPAAGSGRTRRGTRAGEGVPRRESSGAVQRRRRPRRSSRRASSRAAEARPVTATMSMTRWSFSANSFRLGQTPSDCRKRPCVLHRPLGAPAPRGGSVQHVVSRLGRNVRHGSGGGSSWDALVPHARGVEKLDGILEQRRVRALKFRALVERAFPVTTHR
jgi:hypothetical protein